MNNPLHEYLRLVNGHAERMYKLSGYTINLALYRGIIVYAPIISIAAAVAYILAPRYVKLPMVAIALVSSAILIYMVAYAMIRVSTRVGHFERNIVNTLIAAIPLLAAGETLENVVRRLASIERDLEISRELKLIVRDIDEGGFDVVTALKYSIDRVSSPTYRDIVTTLIETYMIGSGMVDALMLKADYLVRSKYSRMRSVMQTLALLTEMYITLVLLLPILIVLISITLTPLGPLSIGSIELSPQTLLILASLVYSPFAGVVMYILIDGVISSIE